MTDRFDAIIIGAGASGLAAARDLSGAGKSIAVLEARERIGGRIFTLHPADVPLPIELGAEFIHGEAADTFSIVEAGALIAYQLPDDHWWSSGGALRRIANFWSRVQRIRARIPARARDASFAEFLDRQKNLSPADRRLALNFVEGYHASHADRISAASLRSSDEEQEEPAQFRIANGYDALIEWLRAGIDPSRSVLHHGTEVAQVSWRRGSVEAVTKRGETFHARTALITIPIGVWKSAAAIRFDPALRDKERALRKLEVGHVVKIVFSFRERFWDADRNFVHSGDPLVPTWWTTAPVRSSMLTGWSGGHAADRLLATNDVVNRALDSLASVLRVKRKKIDSLLDSARTHDWQSDPFSRGAYSYAGVGGEHAHDAVARPIDGTLFFAGEATSSDQTGTVAGAIATGRRAAKQLLRS